MSTIPLESAYLCLNCENLTDDDPRGDVCPFCACKGLVLLSTWIQPLTAGAEPEKEDSHHANH